ncbi:MAG: sensor histidine kinase [Chloroflexi bacterium]|nr:sensor histidine kinase [Chloroflexota bacterium]
MKLHQSILTRVEERIGIFWQWIGATPVALKVIGLIVLPLLVGGIGGALFIRERLGVLLQIHGAQSIQAQIFIALTEQAATVFVGVALLGLGLAVIFTRILVHPLQNIVRAMGRVKAGDLTVQIPIWARDEIGEVQSEFNTMVNSLRETNLALLRQQREMAELNQENLRLLADVQAKRERLEHLLHHALSAQEAERKRLARELHDETGQSLTSILLRLKALQTETDLELIHDRINGLRYLTGETLEEVRRLAMDLRPTALDDLGLVPAIRGYVQEWCKRSGIEIVFTPSPTIDRLPTDHEIILYRAVQEGLTNIVRHAQAHHASVTLEQGARAVWLTIEDDGKGMNPGIDHRNGMGLEGMRERVALVGGRLQVDSAPDAGTRILIELPLGESK